MRPTSLDLRQRIVTSRIRDGLSMGQIAERFRIPRGTVQNILERYRNTGTIEPRPAHPGRHGAFEGEALRRLEHDVLTHPDATLAEYLERSGVPASYVAVHNALRRLGFTRKKNATCGRAATPGRRRQTRGVAELAGRCRSATAGVSR